MGLRVNNIPDIIPASTVMNTTINSIPINLNQVVMGAIQIFFTGTPTGNFKLQASVDPNSGNAAPVHWSDVVNSTFTVTAAGDVMWNVAEEGYNWLRVVYTDTSSGTSTAIITSAVSNTKGL